MAVGQNEATRGPQNFSPCFLLPGLVPFWGDPIFDRQPYDDAVMSDVT